MMGTDLELQTLLQKYLAKYPNSERALAEELLQSVPTIKRWAAGRNLPHIPIARGIIIFLKEKLQTE